MRPDCSNPSVNPRGTYCFIGTCEGCNTRAKAGGAQEPAEPGHSPASQDEVSPPCGTCITADPPGEDPCWCMTPVFDDGLDDEGVIEEYNRAIEPVLEELDDAHARIAGILEPRREAAYALIGLAGPTNPKAQQALRDGKPPLDLIEHAAEVEIAWVMKHGADKYGRRNYVHPDTEILATTYIAAIRRHIGAIAAGETIDPDSGLSHYAHIGANINVVLAAIAAGTFVDDLAVVVTELSAVSNQRHSGS